MKEIIGNFKDVLQNKYMLFTGRAGRREFWLYQLVVVVIAIVLMAVDGALGSKIATMPDGTGGMGILGLIFALATFLPGIGIMIRRLHDTDRSGWWMLLVLIPFIGGLVLLAFALMQGTVGDNRFGSELKRIA